jgi:hypothetical protein
MSAWKRLQHWWRRPFAEAKHPAFARVAGFVIVGLMIGGFYPEVDPENETVG